MLETLRCPGCSTRYVLGPTRVAPGIRRAKCFRCDEIFGIEEAVGRLLSPAAPSEYPALVPESTPPFTLDDLGNLDEAAEPSLFIHQGDVLPPALPVVHDPLEFPEAAPAPVQQAPGLPSGGPYSSARDAIEKLMGAMPEAPQVRTGNGAPMDVEATLDALATTLGAPMAQEAPSAPEPNMSSTVKLSSEEIKIAMAAMGDHGHPAAAAPATGSAPVSAPAPAPTDFPPQVDSLLDPAQNPDLLKVMLEGETFDNLTIEQMTQWIEQGKVRSFHMVARQHSEHWIEASKVPSLRPIFERVRKSGSPLAAEIPAPAPEPPPVKRGLFSGLFGRN